MFFITPTHTSTYTNKYTEKKTLYCIIRLLKKDVYLKVTSLRRFVFFFIHICRYQTWSSLNDIVYFIIYLYIPCRLYPKGPITRFHILYFNRHIRTTTFNIRTLYSCSKLNFELRRGLRVTISYFI